MTTITLSAELSERLAQRAAQEKTDAETLIAEWLGPPFMEDEVAAVQEALEQVEQGETRLASEFWAEHRAKYPDIQ